MAKIDFLCLANSRMKNGRCIAGFNLNSGKWIRLVSHLPSHAYSLEETTLDIGRPIRPLDIANLKIGPASPSFSQSENVLADGGSWKFVRRIDIEHGPDRAILRRAIRTSGPLLNIPEAGAAAIPATIDEIPSSLALIQVKSPAFRKPVNATKRCQFNYRDDQFDLAFTDDLHESLIIGPNRPNPDVRSWLLTISLGQLHKGSYWKLVAGAIPLSA